MKEHTEEALTRVTKANKLRKPTFYRVKTTPINSDTSHAFHGEIAHFGNFFGPKTLVLDLEEVRYISQEELKELAHFKDQLEKGNRKLVLLDVPPDVKRDMDRAKLTGSFRLISSEKS